MSTTSKTTIKLRVPQARILKALLPKAGQRTVPAFSRTDLAKKAGLSPLSGTVNRALNGIPEGSSSGDAHKGLVDLGYLKRIVIKDDSVDEICYEITKSGIKAIQAYLEDHAGRLSKTRDKEVCINHRYTANNGK